MLVRLGALRGAFQQLLHACQPCCFCARVRERGVLLWTSLDPGCSAKSTEQNIRGAEKKKPVGVPTGG